ncbi:MAG: hypothetical protein H6983_01050 [Ectothiorhodospiraceae bacterium]|nr:hypothetical protein [Ectothiorhodospiraceae bacterium]
MAVGTGLQFRSHITLETLDVLRAADKVLFAGADVVTARWLAEINPSAEGLPDYLPGRPRRETYELWVELVMGAVRAGRHVCAAAYGHPGVFVHFTGEAVRRARAEGFRAVMLPGISAEACMLCDLLIDPAPTGWQSYSATVFVRRQPRFDTGTPLVLWQVKVIDAPGPPDRIARDGLARLVSVLLEHYPPHHQVALYEASRNPALEHQVQWLPLAALASARFRLSATLLVPPLDQASERP